LAPGESLDGYLLARAAEEGLPTTMVITSLGAAKYGHIRELTLGADGLDAVANCLRVELGELQSRTYPLVAGSGRRLFFGAAIARELIDTRFRYFSPRALEASAFHRAIWAINGLPFCDEHWDTLTNRCWICDAVQGWHHAHGLDLCDKCVMPLTEVTTPSVPEHLRDRLSFVAGLLHHDHQRRASSLSRLPGPLAHLDAGTAYELLVAVAGVVDPEIRSKGIRRILNRAAEPLRVCEAMARGWDLLVGWPAAFEDFIAERLGKRHGRAGDGNGNASLSFLKLPKTQRVPAAMSKVISEMHDRLSKKPAFALDYGQAQSACGMMRNEVAELRRKGVLKTVFHIDNNAVIPLIDQKSVEAFRASQVEDPVLDRAASQLGITYHAVEQLCCLGLLSTVSTVARGSKRRTERIDGRSLAALNEKLMALAVPKGDGWISLASAYNGVPGFLPWGPAFEALINGNRHFSLINGKQPLVARILIQRADQAWFRALKFDRNRYANFDFATMMSKKDAATILGIHSRHSSEALNKWPSERGNLRTVPVADVEEMSRRFMSVAEAALCLQVYPAKVPQLLAAAGLERSLIGFNRASFQAWLKNSNSSTRGGA